MNLLRPRLDRYVVVDVETTGLYNTDRIVEIAAVTLSAGGETIDEWDTLVNPERDTGPTHIHGVTASMVSAAPTFSEVSAALAERLDGGVLVAHNLPFDARMLLNEYRRIGVDFDAGKGVCTLQATGQKLEYATRSRGIPLVNAHRALADARATAALLRSIPDVYVNAPLRPAIVDHVVPDFRPRTFRRDMADATTEEMPYLARLAERTQHDGERGAALIYMDLLDRAISDLEITDAERAQLAELASAVGLAPQDISETHRRYLDELIAASLRDGIVDQNEAAMLERVAVELGIESEYLKDRVGDQVAEDASIVLNAGMRVCFTGTALYPDGTELPRRILDLAARDLELVSVKDVSKKGCDLLIAADPSSQSGKARKARGYGIPVASVPNFLSANVGELIAVS